MRELARLFKALSDETRLRILGLIMRYGPVCVCEVEALLGITQSKASRHLRYLRDAGILRDVREGGTVNYGFHPGADATTVAVLRVVGEVLPAEATPDRVARLAQMRVERAQAAAPATNVR